MDSAASMRRWREGRHWQADGGLVALTFVSWDVTVGFSTSSKERSPEIVRLLSGEDAPHYECLRVEDILGSRVLRKVVISS